MSSSFEVSDPIQNSPFDEPMRHWFIQEGKTPELREGSRRPAIVYPPRDQKEEWSIKDGTLRPSRDYAPAYELLLVNLIRERLSDWRREGYPGVTRTTLELLQWWRRDGRENRLFFAQLEAAETIVFLIEARADFRQGVAVPVEELNSKQPEVGATPFTRYACKMATGAGKTTVMGMLAAWSILNKVNDRSDARFSDVVLVVCPNVTIRDRLQELDPARGEASLYRTRDLVPPHIMTLLTRGRVLITNWHVFELQAPKTGESAKVVRTGVALRTREKISIGKKTTTARGTRYLTEEDLDLQIAAGLITVLEEKRDKDGHLKKVQVESVRHVESEAAWIQRILGREVGGKQNILLLNDEAHHAYRIHREEKEEDEEDTLGEDFEDFFKEATVWVEGLDRIQKLRGINFCVDLSATPYFLGRAGKDTNRPFPWVVSDFGLVDAIESGLVKIPQLAVRDTTGKDIPGYFNIWRWILEEKLTPAERGGKKANPKPEAILKYAHTPISMLASLWDELRREWEKTASDPRPPVFILVCKNTKIARVLYEWIAEGTQPTEISPFKIDALRNMNGHVRTVRVDSKVVHETDTGGAKSDEHRWMRCTLDTVGTRAWTTDTQGRSVYPEGFDALADKLGKPLHPPGRDVRCIVSVGMLTEGWDCNTVTHIVGLRPFMSQLLCEQVVGRGLRRSSYELSEDGKFTEEVAKVFGVPFEVIPFKQNPQAPGAPKEKRHHVFALPEKEMYRIEFPRVEGYTQSVRNRIAVRWDTVPRVLLDPKNIPPEVEMKGLSVTTAGKFSFLGPGRIDDATLEDFRARHRIQELIFDLAQGLCRQYVAQRECEVPTHVLFPQLARTVQRYVNEKVDVLPPNNIKDLFLSPYYGWLIEKLREAIHPDVSQGEAPEVPRYETSRGPGSTDDVDFHTSREVREVRRCHLNYAVADTKVWEQSAAYYIDRHQGTRAFVKNSNLGFAIPYMYDGQSHDYVPDFLIRLNTEESAHLILETKGYDPTGAVKRDAAQRWVDAVNADGKWGLWSYTVARQPEEVPSCIDEALRRSNWPALNKRRGELIKKQVSHGLSEIQEEELQDLQQKADEHARSVAPRPLKELEDLARRLTQSHGDS